MGEGVLEVPRQPGGRRGLISHRVVAARVKGIGAGNEPVSAIKSVPGPEEKVVRSGRGRKGADPPESDCAVGRADIGCRLAVEEPAAFFISGKLHMMWEVRGAGCAPFPCLCGCQLFTSSNHVGTVGR